jgi:hypothetical protein
MLSRRRRRIRRLGLRCFLRACGSGAIRRERRDHPTFMVSMVLCAVCLQRRFISWRSAMRLAYSWSAMLLTPNKMDETHGHGSSGSWNSAVCASLSVSRSSVGSLRRPGTLLVIYPRWGAAPADRKLVAVTTVLRRMIPCFWLETSLSSSVILAMASGEGANFLNTMSTSKTAA